MLIWQLEVISCGYTRKEDWLGINDVVNPYDYLDDDKDENYMIYFSNFESMSNYIDKITKGYNQFSASAYEHTDGDEERLEYHNGVEWDSEIYLTTKKVRMHESLVRAIKAL